jgi:N-acetylneuraminate synthase
MSYKEFIKECKKEYKSIIKPFVIAEAGVNHENSIENAIRLIEEAKEAGANAIKFQTYRAETIASRQSPAYWDLTKEPTRSQYELFSKYDRFWKKEFEILKEYCDKIDIEFMSTPFDIESASFLNDLIDVFKISSSDITNKPFIEYICAFNKPVILSTGASTVDEINQALSWVSQNGNNTALMHCVLSYPTSENDANLLMIKFIKDNYSDCIPGYSDHTIPSDMKVLELATLMGAMIIEKHFTFDKTLSGNDHYHAMDKEDLKNFFKNIERTIDILGKYDKTYLPAEEQARQNARRSLIAKRNIPAGKKIEKDDLTWKRPATGISPKYIDEIIDKEALYNIEVDTILQWKDIK